MDTSGEGGPVDRGLEFRFSGSHHFDSVLDATQVKAEIEKCYTSGANLILGYNQGGIHMELELHTINNFSTELSAGSLYDFMALGGSPQGNRVVTVFIPHGGGKAVIGIPW